MMYGATLFSALQATGNVQNSLSNRSLSDSRVTFEGEDDNDDDVDENFEIRRRLGENETGNERHIRPAARSLEGNALDEHVDSPRTSLLRGEDARNGGSIDAEQQKRRNRSFSGKSIDHDTTIISVESSSRKRDKFTFDSLFSHLRGGDPDDVVGSHERSRRWRWCWHVQSNIGISPTNKWMILFDYVLLLSLLVTATVTVYVVCVHMTMDDGRRTDVLHWRLAIDIFNDVVFFCDFVLQFFRSYREDRGRGRLVFDLREIRQKYVRSRWFLPDLISSLPFDLVILAGETLGAQRNNLRFLRLIRLVRIHRVSRILNTTPTFKKWMLKVDSRKLHMFRLVVGLILVEHWASCLFVWLGKEEILLNDTRYTWIDRLAESGFVFNRNSELDLYVIGLYWASTVSSSVGSGDIVPANPSESMFVAFFQILGGCLFAYSVSSLVGQYAAMHALEEGRGAAVDAVNEMLEELRRERADVDEEKVRAFVWQACDARAARTRRRFAPGGALAQLSPQLKDEVLMAERYPWIRRVWFLDKCRPRLAGALCRESKWVSYAPGDHVILSSDQLIIVTRGVATTRDRILVRGSVLGLGELATVKRGGVNQGSAFVCINFVEALLLESASVERAVRTEGDPYELKRFLRARAVYGLRGWWVLLFATVKVANDSRVDRARRVKSQLGASSSSSTSISSIFLSSLVGPSYSASGSSSLPTHQQHHSVPERRGLFAASIADSPSTSAAVPIPPTSFSGTSRLQPSSFPFAAGSYPGSFGGGGRDLGPTPPHLGPIAHAPTTNASNPPSHHSASVGTTTSSVREETRVPGRD